MGELRLIVSEELHKSLKLRALNDDKTLKQLIVEFLEKGLKN